MKCKICEFDSKNNLKLFSNHLNFFHKISSEEYSIKFIFNGERPKCLECGLETRYVSFSFKEYCKNHSNLKCIEAGKIGGKKKNQWNKNKNKENDLRIKEAAEKVLGENNHFFGKKHSKESKVKISEAKRLDKVIVNERILERQDEFLLVTNIDQYESRQHQYLNFKCTICNNTQNKTLQAFERGSLCDYCYRNNISQAQKEIYDWIKNDLNIIDAELSNRDILSPKEIDIYIPSKKVGIEFHGLYWHSELNNNDKRKHYDKVDLALKNGIKIIQIFQDEWENKKEIVKSLICNKLGICSNKIFARKCIIKEIKTSDERKFFDENHVSGYTPSKYCFGLYHKDVLVSCISLRTPRQQKWKNYLEVARYASQKNNLIVGGISKLIKYVLNKYQTNILTYADRRVGEGNGYLKAGFKFIGITEPNYWYTDLKNRFDRFKFRACDGKSEKEIAAENKVYKIWGAGNNIYVIDIGEKNEINNS